MTRAASPLLSRQRLLLVDDNPANRQLARLMLEQLGYDVDTVSSGDHAIRMAATNHYAAVLMDCEMPGTDGYEATRQIRLDQSSEALPIIAFTTTTSPSDRQRCAAAGMTDVLTKPATAEMMGRTLLRWSGRASCRRASLSDSAVLNTLPDEERGECGRCSPVERASVC